MLRILLINSLLCSIPIQMVLVIGDPTNTTENNVINKRYVIEHNFRPPIFGSYKYDPIKQAFDLPKGVTIATHNTSTHQGQDHKTNVYNPTPVPDKDSSTSITHLRF